VDGGIWDRVGGSVVAVAAAGRALVRRGSARGVQLCHHGVSAAGGYAINGEALWFTGEHFASFFPFYVASIVIFPVAGLAALSPRWSRGWQTPAAVAAVVIAASLYGYRDGLTSGLAPAAAMLAGAVPGQRFILPASVIACVPAARWLDERLGQRGFA
jgi:hypothetical protein